MKQTLRLLMLMAVFVSSFHATPSEASCKEVPDGETCEQVCDGEGKNCNRRCFPRMRKVCEEAQPPPQSTRPTGGLLKDKDGNPSGGWGGATIPIK